MSTTTSGLPATASRHFSLAQFVKKLATSLAKKKQPPQDAIADSSKNINHNNDITSNNDAAAAITNMEPDLHILYPVHKKKNIFKRFLARSIKKTSTVYGQSRRIHPEAPPPTFGSKIEQQSRQGQQQQQPYHQEQTDLTQVHNAGDLSRDVSGVLLKDAADVDQDDVPDDVPDDFDQEESFWQDADDFFGGIESQDTYLHDGLDHDENFDRDAQEFFEMCDQVFHHHHADDGLHADQIVFFAAEDFDSYFSNEAKIHSLVEIKTIKAFDPICARPETLDPRPDIRRTLLRSRLMDKGLQELECFDVCQSYIKFGRWDPNEIVNILERIVWFYRCTNYDPTRVEGLLELVRLHPRTNRRRETRSEEETSMSASPGGATTGETKGDVQEWEEYDHYRMAALDDWLTHRLEQGQYQSYKLDPEGPYKPPKSIWPMLDRIDMGHKLLEFAADKVYRMMITKKKNEIKRKETLDKIAAVEVYWSKDKNASRIKRAGALDKFAAFEVHWPTDKNANWIKRAGALDMFGAERIYQAIIMDKKKHEIKREEVLDKFEKSKGQIRDIVDAPEAGSGIRITSELSRRKRRMIDGDKLEEAKGSKLSTLLERHLGSDWHTQVVERTNDLAKYHLF
ncbi:hypothetical protein BGX29_011764 [Mortierella sp. GBA35]|nr:hypothetical protein BGX29_011764 [Mortierella sp. GBA35]